MAIREEKEIKPSLFVDDMILYIENPKDATRILVELINKFGKVSGYRSNTQKLLPAYSVYTNSERSENSFW